MQYDPARHHRRSIRLKDYDYTQAGAYFVTLCTQHWACVLGDVIDDEMQLSVTGTIVAETWEWLAQQYPYVILDAYVVMPNHVHGIIVIKDTNVGAVREPPQQMPRKPLGRLIGVFKTVSTKRINTLNATPGLVFWQRNYYEHIIRHEDALNRIRRYIIHNPMKWTLDRENPHARR